VRRSRRRSGVNSGCEIMLQNCIIINQIISPWTNTIIGPLIGAFTGVLIGFLINELQRSRLKYYRKLFFRNILLNEIDKSIDIFVENKYELIPMYGWNSLLNSGEIALFKDDATKLNDTYSEIQWYNNELKILRYAVENEFINFFDKSGEQKTRRSEILRNYTNDRKEKLLQKLFDAKKLLKQMVIDEWWQFWK
jgi:hypothetical protein